MAAPVGREQSSAPHVGANTRVSVVSRVRVGPIGCSKKFMTAMPKPGEESPQRRRRDLDGGFALAAFRRRHKTSREPFPEVAASAIMNFLLQPIGPTRTRLTTETRVFATDVRSRRLFAPYWRAIYPGQLNHPDDVAASDQSDSPNDLAPSERENGAHSFEATNPAK